MEEDIQVMKTRINSQVVLVPVSRTELETIPDGEVMNARVSEIPDALRRSHEQLGLYWASCDTVAYSTDDAEWNSKIKVDEQTKIKLRHIKYWIHYQDAEGAIRLNIKTKSISFKELPHLESCHFFDDAFKLHAEKIGMTVDEWIEYVKFRMEGKS